MKKWKTLTCMSGESCWCRAVVTEDEEDEIISDGAISKKDAEYIVKLHNSFTENNKLEDSKKLKPFEVNKVYTTKFATKEKFEIKEIVYKPNSDKINYFKGIYLDCPHIGICPLDFGRLIQETE